MFCTGYGHYKYTIISFGQVIVPEAYQGHINTVLCKYLDLFCIAYLDDIVVYFYLVEEHAGHVKLILAKLQQVGLYLKLANHEYNT